jgi:hypothetical protein
VTPNRTTSAPDRPTSRHDIDESRAPASDQPADFGLINILPRSARLVIEIGCGDGALGAAYKRFNPGARYIGVEADRRLAAQAGARLDQVIIAQPDAFDPAAAGLDAQAVDCLAYRVSLTSLQDPAAVIRRHARLLAADGVVVAWIENPMFWAVLESALKGRPASNADRHADPYEFRAFTIEGVRRLFADAGLVATDARPGVIDERAAAPFLAAIAPALERMGIDRTEFGQRAVARNYIVRAARRAFPRLLIQAATLDPQAACVDVRVSEPLAFMATVPGVATQARAGREGIRVISTGESKILLLQRRIFTYPGDLTSLRKAVDAGYVTVTEIDDHPDFFPVFAENRYLSFRGVHAIQTSTETLAAFLRQFNPNVAVFGNHMAELPPPRKFSADQPPTIFFGALNREPDWTPIMPALNRVLERRPETRVEVIHDRAFFDALTTAHKRFTPTCPYPAYQAILGQADICLMPLEDKQFNRAKSDLKFLEAAAFGAVAFASPVVYASTIEDGRTGILFRNRQEFEARLTDLIDDLARRHAIARAAYDWVKANRLLAQHFPAQLAWYRTLVAERERLTDELKARLPEMFGGAPSTRHR